MGAARVLLLSIKRHYYQSLLLFALELCYYHDVICLCSSSFMRLNAFQAFCLEPQPSDKKAQTCLKKLAATYKLDPHQVSAGFFDFRKFAVTRRSNFG